MNKYFTKMIKDKYLFFFFILGIISGFFYLFNTNTDLVFLDLEIYQKAINEFNLGNSAYKSYGGLYFVYSPYILFFFSWFKENLTYFLLFFYILTILFFLILKQTRAIIYFSFISSIIFFNHSLVKSILTGNITIFLHLIILVIFFLKNNKSKNIYFLIVIFISSIIKPYMLAYLLLTIDRESLFINLIKILLISAMFFLFFSSQYFFYPNYFIDFINSLYNQSLGTSIIADQDIGLAPYSIFSYFFEKKTSLALHFIFILFLCFSFYKRLLLSINLLDEKLKKKIYFFLMIILITFLNPRMKIYDWWLEVSLSTAIIFMVLENIRFSKNLIILVILTIFISSLLAIINSDFIKYLRVYIPPFLAIILCCSINKKNLKSVSFSKIFF